MKPRKITPKVDLENTPSVGALVYELNNYKKDLVDTKEKAVSDVKEVISLGKEVLIEAESKTREMDEKYSNLSDEVVSVLNDIKSNGLKGDPGENADEEAMEERLLAKIPKLEEIVNQISIDEIAEKASGMVKPTPASLKIIKEEVQLDKEEIVPMLNEASNLSELELTTKNIKGLEKVLKNLETVKGGYVHGGGDHVRAGANITITDDGNGNKTISAPGGGSGITLKTNGTDNGSQTTLNLAQGSGVTLTDNGTGTVTIAATGGGTGDVVGPASATDSVPVLFDGTTGKLIKNSTPTGTGNPVLQNNPALVLPSFAAVTVSGGILTLPTGASDTLVSKNSTDTLTNKTLTSPVIGTSQTNSYATASTVPYFDASKNLISSAVTPTELGYISGVTSAIQTQLNAKGAGTVTSVTSANSDATVATTTTTPVITIVSAPKLTTARTIGTLTGDITTAGSSFDGTANNTNATTLATVNSNVGAFGSATQVATFTVNAKGLTTAAANVTVTPAVGSITGLGTGVGTFLATPSSANLLAAVTDETGTGALVFGTTPTLATPVINGLPTGTGVSSTSTASTLVARDANKNIFGNNIIGDYTTTATAAGTTTLTVSSTYQQFFTGSTTQTVTLPVTSTLTLGHAYYIVNNSTGLVTVNSSGANAITILAGGTSAIFTCILTSGTTAASWSPAYAGNVVTSGKKLSATNTLTLAGTDGTTMTFPTTSATIARTDAANTFTGVQTMTSPNFTTPVLGTPTSGTLTNCTGLPIAGLVSSTSTALGVGSLELGHATDTTLSRSAAGVLAVEGVVIPSISSTNTITNKRPQPRTASSTTASTLTPDLSSANVYYRTTQTATLTINAPTGTPVIGETIAIYVDSAGAQTLTMDTTYKVFGAAFPATTTAGKTLMITAQFNGTDWKTLWANAV